MSRLLLPLLLALTLLGGGYALLHPAQAYTAAPLAAWITAQNGENLLQAAPADALQDVRTLARLPDGEIVDVALSPGGGYLAFVTVSGRGETLWLLSLSGRDLRRIEQAAGFGRLRWEDGGLAYNVYPSQGRPQRRALLLDGVGRRDALLRLIPLEEGRVRLSRFDPRSGRTEALAALPPARWRLLDWEGDWAAAERYPHGAQVIALKTGEFRGLGEARRFVGFLPPLGYATRPQREPEPSPLLVAATPTCEPVPDGCPVERVYGHQPARGTMGEVFLQAAFNTLSDTAPTYEDINTGRPPVKQPVSPQRPLPHLILRGIAWQEAAWLQFLHDGAPLDDVDACTIVSFDCGYGLMQVTSCMSGGCGWLDPPRAAAELPYNLGAGTNILIQKWNSVPYLGENDPTNPAEWYYAVIAYNGFSVLNDPNNTDRFNPLRPPFGEGSGTYRYPYQERVYGWMAHPPYVSGEALWRPTGIPPVPRGIFGLRSPNSWTPPSETPRPLTWLFHDVGWPSPLSPTLRVQNTQPYTLAVDVLFYNADGSFNRRYLPPSPDDPLTVEPYLRVAPSGTFTLPLQSVFFTDTFTGFLRLYGTEGLSVTLEAAAPEKSWRAYLPLVQRGVSETVTSLPAAALTCTQVLTNGGFEVFLDGRPAGWQEASAGGYVLADSTWFRTGHFGGYLGGYDLAADTLSQTFSLPTGALTVTLSLAWDVTSEVLSPTLTGDVLTVTLVDAAGAPLGSPWVLHETDAPGGWALSTVTWPVTNTLSATLLLEARTDEQYPAAFFVDDVRVEGCVGH